MVYLHVFLSIRWLLIKLIFLGQKTKQKTKSLIVKLREGAALSLPEQSTVVLVTNKMSSFFCLLNAEKICRMNIISWWLATIHRGSITAVLRSHLVLLLQKCKTKVNHFFQSALFARKKKNTCEIFREHKWWTQPRWHLTVEQKSWYDALRWTFLLSW